MRIVTCTPRDVPRILRFQREVHSHDPYYRDDVSAIQQSILSGRSVFCEAAQILPVLVEDANGPRATCTYIIADRLPDVVQIAFFDALPDSQAAVDLIVGRARELAATHNATRIVVGMDGHMNYGFGLLAGPFDSPSCFGSSHSPPYYIDYFRRGATTVTDLKSYEFPIKPADLGPERRIIERAARRLTFRMADFRCLREEIGLYTALNNQCFVDHPLYFPRRAAEDYELFHPFRHFLHGENLLIAEEGGRPVGFLLWYPDFNELVPPQGSVGLGTVLKYRLLRRRIRRMKIAEIGVLPDYVGSGCAMGLLHKLWENVRERFDV